MSVAPVFLSLSIVLLLRHHARKGRSLPCRMAPYHRSTEKRYRQQEREESARGVDKPGEEFVYRVTTPC